MLKLQLPCFRAFSRATRWSFTETIVQQLGGLGRHFLKWAAVYTPDPSSSLQRLNVRQLARSCLKTPSTACKRLLSPGFSVDGDQEGVLVWRELYVEGSTIIQLLGIHTRTCVWISVLQLNSGIFKKIRLTGTFDFLICKCIIVWLYKEFLSSNICHSGTIWRLHLVTLFWLSWVCAVWGRVQLRQWIYHWATSLGLQQFWS